MKDSQVKLLVDDKINHASTLADIRDQRRIYCLSIAFFVMASGYNAAQNYITTLLGDDGNYSLVSLYIFLGLSALFGPCSLQWIRGTRDNPLLLYGEKRALVLGCFCYAPYLATLALGDYLYVQLFTAALLGTGSGILWITQGSIMATCSRAHNRDRMAGLFWGVYQLGTIAGNLLGFVVHSNVPSKAVLFLMCASLVLVATNLHLFVFQTREVKEIMHPSIATSATKRPYKPFLQSGGSNSNSNSSGSTSSSGSGGSKNPTVRGSNSSVVGSSRSKINSALPHMNASNSDMRPSVNKKGGGGVSGGIMPEKGGVQSGSAPQFLLGNEVLDSIDAESRKGSAESKMVLGSVTLSDKSKKIQSKIDSGLTQSQTDATLAAQAKELDTLWGSIRAVMRLVTVPQSLLMAPMCLFIGAETGYYSGTFPTLLDPESIGLVLGVLAIGEVLASFLIGALVERMGQGVALGLAYVCMAGGIYLSVWGNFKEHRDSLQLFNVPVVALATALLIGIGDAILNTMTAARFGSLADDWHLFHTSAGFAFYQLFNSAAVAASMGYTPSLPLDESLAQIWIIAVLGILAFVGFLLGQPKGSPPKPRVRVSMFASVRSQKAEPEVDYRDSVVDVD